jgi:hypothetical protein
MGINLSLKDVESSLSSFLSYYIAYPMAMVLNTKGYQYILMNLYETQTAGRRQEEERSILDLS